MHAQANAATPAAAPAGGAEWRARLEASHRAEAVALAAEPVWEPPESEADETGEARPVPGQCPRCRARVNVGVTVAIRHRPGCAVAAVKAAVCARARRTGRVACPPAAAAEPLAAVADVRPALRHRNRNGCRPRRRRRQRGSYTSQAPALAAQEEMRHRREREEEQIRRHGGIRPWVVLRWFVSGCRVAVNGWLASVRGVIHWADGRLKVWVGFDDGWAPEQWALDDVIDVDSAWAAA